jgi:hypothetical protein
MKFEKAFEAFVAFLDTLSEAMTAANSTNPVVNFFRCTLKNPADYRLRQTLDIFLRKF